jgi:hypothetical protein
LWQKGRRRREKVTKKTGYFTAALFIHFHTNQSRLLRKSLIFFKFPPPDNGALPPNFAIVLAVTKQI